MPAFFLAGFKGTDIASAATITIPTDGDRFDVTGTTAITTMTTNGRAVGSRFRLRAVSAGLVFTYNGTSLILGNAASYSSTAGDYLFFEIIGTNQVREISARAYFLPVPQATKTGAYTFTDADYEVLANLSGAVSFTLPTAVGRAGRRFALALISATSATNIATLATTSSQTIGGAGYTTRKLNVINSRIEVESDGANWLIVAHEVPGTSPITAAATITSGCLLTERRGGTFSTTLNQATTLAAPTSPHDGQEITFMLTQDATGSRLVTWNAVFVFNTTLPSPTLSTAAGKVDYIRFKYNSAAVKWHCVGQSLGN